MMKEILMLVVLAALSGCSTQVTRVDITGLELSNQVRVIDLRPQQEKEGETFSFSLPSEAYGLSRVEESATTPSAIRILQHRVFEALSTTRPDVPEVRVHHLVVYRNRQSEFRRTVFLSGLAGAVGAAAAGPPLQDLTGATMTGVDAMTFRSLQSDEFKRALYGERENPGRGSVHIVFIETEISGKRVFTRTLVPIKADIGESLKGALESSARLHLAHYKPS